MAQGQTKLKPGQDVTALMPGQDVTALFQSPPPESSTTPQSSSYAGRSLAGQVGGAVGMVTGAIKGAASTATGLGELVHKIPGVSSAVDALYGRPGVSKASFPAAREALRPTSTGEAIGFGVEQIGEFMVPAGLVTKLKTAVKTGKGILDAIIGAGIEGGSAAAVSTAQRGTTEGAATTGAVATGAALAVPPVAKAIGWLGQKVGNALIKPSIADVKNGFQISNVYKHQLGGSLSDTFDKSTTKLHSLSGELKAELSKTIPGQPAPSVDVLGALADVAQDLARSGQRTVGRNVNINAAVQKLLDDPWVAQSLQNGKADLLTANEIKQAMGELGAWSYGKPDIDANAMELVANALYSKLRGAIEAAAPVGPTRIAALNKQMGEIIPVKLAVIRRIPVADRQNIINLGDMIGMSTGAWGLSLANRVLKSGQAGNAMVNVAERSMRGLTPIAQTVAGTASQIRK